MARIPRLYQRLTRNSAGLGSYSSLWLASDHLMIVRSTGYNESYTRVQLRDIKAIFLTRTSRRLWWTLGWSIVAGASGVFFAEGLFRQQTLSVFSIFLAFGLAGLVGNLFLGPGCRVCVVTGVQTAELPSLVRMKRARAVVLLRLEPLINAAQADLAAAPPVPA